MFSKINFTYKKNVQNHKKERILKQLQTNQRILNNDKNSINNTLNLTNKVDYHKIVEVKEIVSQSKETSHNVNNEPNFNIELKINDDTYNNRHNNRTFVDTIAFINEHDALHKISSNENNTNSAPNLNIEFEINDDTYNNRHNNRAFLDTIAFINENDAIHKSIGNVNNTNSAPNLNIEFEINEDAYNNRHNNRSFLDTIAFINDHDAIHKSIGNENNTNSAPNLNIELKINDLAYNNRHSNRSFLDTIAFINDHDAIHKSTGNENNAHNAPNLDITVKINEDTYNNRHNNHSFLDTIVFLNEMDVAANEMIIHKHSMVPYNVERIRARGIKIINNVYQSKYNFGRSNCTGLGDFIRGCYFILEFCDEYHFEPKIIFNNPISNFLKIKTHHLGLITNILSSIQFFKNNNFSKYNIVNNFIVDPERDNTNIMADFVNYVVDSPCHYSNVFVFCNSFPRNDVPEKNKEYMRNILEPTDEIKFLIIKTLDELHLKIKGYNVIHIRSGDAFLKNEKNSGFSSSYIQKLIANIYNDVKHITENNQTVENHYLIIADNNNVKLLLKKKFPDFKLLVNPITHFGEGVILEGERVKNTLIDFYLLSFANYIMSYSSYEHGSGFSYWCAKTFNVPYTCKYVV
jgi:hypothetical protein